MQWIVQNFCKKNECNLSDVMNLKRTPRDVYQMLSRCQPFVCNNLKNLGNLLFDKDLTHVFEIADKLSRSKIDTKKNSKGNGILSAADRQMINRDRAEAEANTVARKQYSKYMQSFNASEQWHKTK